MIKIRILELHELDFYYTKDRNFVCNSIGYFDPQPSHNEGYYSGPFECDPDIKLRNGQPLNGTFFYGIKYEEILE